MRGQKMTSKIRTLIAMAVPVLALALAPSAALAQSSTGSFTGNYPVEIPRDTTPAQLHLFLANEDGNKADRR